jgi:hypothetical protein
MNSTAGRCIPTVEASARFEVGRHALQRVDDLLLVAHAGENPPARRALLSAII